MASYSMGFLVAVALCACTLSALAARDLTDGGSIVVRHEQWMAKYGRVYNDATEKARRLEVFKANVEFIESVNARNANSGLEANQFADMTNDEFRATHTGYKLPVGGRKGKMMTGFRYANVSLDALPTSVDWRTKGAVTPVKDQGECGKHKFISCLNSAQFTLQLND
jgi:C1A family cysteine protease